MAGKIPPTRWEQHRDEHEGYRLRFAELIEQGEDIDGEARLVDAIAPRRARVLDAGSGMGRVAGALAARGHRVVAVEKDPVLVTDSRARYPDVPVVESDILGLSPALLTGRDLPSAYDVVVLVGNVLTLVADGTERRVLRTLADLLAPDGRVVVGYHLVGGPPHNRHYPFDELAGDATAAGLEVLWRFGTYQLGPPSEDYVVAVLARQGDLVPRPG